MAPAALLLLAAGDAIARPIEAAEPLVRYATEPSTGSMVLAALVVIAAVRRGRSPESGGGVPH